MRSSIHSGHRIWPFANHESSDRQTDRQTASERARGRHDGGLGGRLARAWRRLCAAAAAAAAAAASSQPNTLRIQGERGTSPRLRTDV